MYVTVALDSLGNHFLFLYVLFFLFFFQRNSAFLHKYDLKLKRTSTQIFKVK